MNEIIDQFTTLFGGDKGHVAQFIAWLFGVQTLLKLIENIIVQPMFDRIIKYVAESPEKDDDYALYWVLKSKPYRFLSFLASILLRVKLPSVASVFNVPADGTGNTETITKNEPTP